jgi:hypothetical protein
LKTWTVLLPELLLIPSPMMGRIGWGQRFCPNIMDMSVLLKPINKIQIRRKIWLHQH